MIRRLGLAATAALSLLLAAPATGDAQVGLFDVSGSSQGRFTGILSANVRVSGTVTVDFHGDPGGDCASHGLCDVSGSVTWQPARSGDLTVFGFREGGKQTETSVLSLGGDGGDIEGASTSAVVRRAATAGAPAGLCTDAGSAGFFAATRPHAGTGVPITLVGEAEGGLPPADSFRTRCAGPTASDLKALFPTGVISARAFRRGRTVDFSTERPFASHGLAGTVHSTVALRIRKATGGHGDFIQELTDKGTRAGRGHRVRALTASYRIKRVSGQVATDIGGLADPDLCGPLDACGLLGTVTVAPTATSGDVELFARASARHSAADLRRALGLQAGRHGRGVATTGFGGWDDTGSVSSALTRAGAPDCSDSEPLLAGTLTLAFGRRHVLASYGEGPDAGGGDLLRSRCPGPGSADVAAIRPLATGSLPKSALRRRTVTLRLHRGGSFSADGYSGRTRPDVTIVLRRTRVRQQTFTEPDFVPQLSQTLRRALR